jgi:hypothetical protein
VVKEAPADEFGLHFRIPGWCTHSSVKLNGQALAVPKGANGYTAITRKWRAGDKIELLLDMPSVLLESNPFVEETRNQVAVKRGPLVYCLESTDLPKENIFGVVIPSDIRLFPMPMKIDNGNVVALTGRARLMPQGNWKNNLYRVIDRQAKPVNIKLIPYYAWANRGKSNMTVWMPVTW